MAHASTFRELSIRGRYAFALVCVQRLCDSFGLGDGFVRQEIEAHWDMLAERYGCHWFDSHPYPEQYEDFVSHAGPGRIDDDQMQSLFHALSATRWVICGSCYAALSDIGSMCSLLEVVGVLCRWGVPLPDLDRFRFATWSGDFGTGGGGERVTRADFGM